MNKELERRAVLLSAELYDQIEERVKVANFNSVEEYVTFVLEEVVKDEQESEGAFSKEEEEEVKRRLKGLGYLD